MFRYVLCVCLLASAAVGAEVPRYQAGAFAADNNNYNYEAVDYKAEVHQEEGKSDRS